METKKSKYDTNPLDPDVEHKAEESRGGGSATKRVGGATRQVGSNQPGPAPNEAARQNVYSEAPTRRYDNPPLDAPYVRAANSTSTAAERLPESCQQRAFVALGARRRPA